MLTEDDACVPSVHQTWCQSIAEGRNYASDGYSHLLDFTVDAVRMGENGSELHLPEGGKTVAVKITAAAMLGEVHALQPRLMVAVRSRNACVR